MDVSLTPTLEKYVQAEVDSGGYESASEVIRDGLRALQESEQGAAEFWAAVREKVVVARRQVAEGHTHDGEAAMDEILAELHAPGIFAIKPDDVKKIMASKPGKGKKK